MRQLVCLIFALGLVLTSTAVHAGPHPTSSPPPSPVPILLVHGVNEPDPKQSWAKVSQALAPRSVTIFKYDWHNGWDDPAIMAALDRQVGVLASQSRTGQIDIIAHSNGGLVSRYYMTLYWGKHSHQIRNLIMIGTPNKGSFGAYATRLSTMLNDPDRYQLPESWRKRGQDLFNSYKDEEIWSLNRLWSQPRPFFRWVREERPGTWRSMRFSSANETGGTDLFTEGLQQLAALYRGINDEYEYTPNGVIPKDSDEIDDLNDATLWISEQLGLDPWSRHIDRLLPQAVELDMGLSAEGDRLTLELLLNPRLRDPFSLPGYPDPLTVQTEPPMHKTAPSANAKGAVIP